MKIQLIKGCQILKLTRACVIIYLQRDDDDDVCFVLDQNNTIQYNTKQEALFRVVKKQTIITQALVSFKI
jgi:hypothetical protein